MEGVTNIVISILVALHVTFLMVEAASAFPLHGSGAMDRKKDLERGLSSVPLKKDQEKGSSSYERFLKLVGPVVHKSRDWARDKREANRGRHSQPRADQPPRMRDDLCVDAGHFEDCFICGKMADDARIFYGCCSGEELVTYFCKRLLY